MPRAVSAGGFSAEISMHAVAGLTGGVVRAFLWSHRHLISVDFRPPRKILEPALYLHIPPPPPRPPSQKHRAVLRNPMEKPVPDIDCVGRKRDRGFESREEPSKRSCSEWTSAEGILSKLLSEDDDDGSIGESIVDGVVLREELVSDVMRSLEEEIERPSEAPAPTGAATDIEYLSVASDDELGLPPSPPVFQKPGADDALFDQNFWTDHAACLWNDRFEEQEFLQIRRAADSLWAFDDYEFASSVAYADAADWFDRPSEVF